LKTVIHSDNSSSGQKISFELLGPVEVAKRLGISLETLYSWTSQKLIPHVKLGNRLKFLPRDLENWVQSKQVKTQEL
jgi:excisionase family DNA binding protein